MKVKFRRSDLLVANGRLLAWPTFATGILLLFSGAINAAEWVIVHTSPDGDRYSYDASKLTMSGNEITYWKKVTFQSAQPYKGSLAASAMYRERINCAEHTLKPLSHVIHAASSAVIEQVAAESEAAAIVPETVGDVFEQKLCPILKSRHEEPPSKPQPLPPAKVKERVEPPVAPTLEKIEQPAPPAMEKIEAPTPPPKAKIEAPTPPEKTKIEIPAPPAKAIIETPAPPAKAKIETPAPPLNNVGDSGLL